MSDIRSLIRTIPDFPKPGVNFRDVTPIFENAAAFQHLVHMLATQWYGKVDRIAALEARGFPFGSPLALALRVPLALVRKKGKLPGPVLRQTYEKEYGLDEVEMHTDAVQPGEHILVLDDLLATGGTAEAACKLVEQAGGVVVGCQFVIELDGLPGRQVLRDYEVHALEVFDA